MRKKFKTPKFYVAFIFCFFFINNLYADIKPNPINQDNIRLNDSLKTAPEDSVVPKINEKYDNLIDVGAPGRKKVRFAIPNFYSEPGLNSDISVRDNINLSNRLREILDFTNWFYFIPKDAYTAPQHVANLPFSAENWTTLKTEYVILGRLLSSKSDKSFNMELKLFDVKARAMILGKVYTSLNLKTSDIALRRFSDIVVETLTGTPGPFMTQIAFVGRTSIKSKNSDIFICDFDGKNVRQITNNKSINLSPSWSPDGTKLTYTSFVEGKPDIYQYDFETQKTVRLTRDKSNNSGANWNPEGTKIAFSATTDRGETHIYSISSDGGERKPMIAKSEIEVEPSFSPNGKLLAFTSNKYGKPMIFIKNLINDEITRLTYAGWYNASATWDTEGKTLAFASYDRDIDRWDLFKINSDGTNLERLTLKTGDNEKPSFSPDGRFIIFQSNRGLKVVNSIEGNHNLYVISRDGGVERKIQTRINDLRQPAWSPRLDKIYF